LKDIFIVDKEEVDDAKNMCDEDSSFKKIKIKKSHNFNQNPKRFFSTSLSMVLFVCKKKMRFVSFCAWMLACVVYIYNTWAFL
jgi:hypothetical protein